MESREAEHGRLRGRSFDLLALEQHSRPRASHPGSWSCPPPPPPRNACRQHYSSSPMNEFPMEAQADCENSGNVHSPKRLSPKQTGCYQPERTQRGV